MFWVSSSTRLKDYFPDPPILGSWHSLKNSHRADHIFFKDFFLGSDVKEDKSVCWRILDKHKSTQSWS